MKIFVDPGHGGADAGATFGPLREKDVTLGVGLALCESLQSKNHITSISRLSDYRVPLHRRARLANQNKSDLFISLHTNADPDPDQVGDLEARGSEIWIYPGSKKGRKLAEAIALAVPVFFPGRTWRGIKEANFAVLRLTSMPAVLVELAFIDTEESSRLYDRNVQGRIAETIAAGVEYYRGEKVAGSAEENNL